MLHKEIESVNNEIKILTTDLIKKELQSHEAHMKRVLRTFGDFIGRMYPIPDEVFELVDTDTPISFLGLANDTKFQLVETPGHSPDHVSPTIFKKHITLFMYNSEATGSLIHSKKLVTLPSTMPPDFRLNEYISSLDKIIELQPENIGYGHFGAVKGKEICQQILKEHRKYSYYFRDFVKNHYLTQPATEYLVNQFLEHEIKTRSELTVNSVGLWTRTIVALVYRQLIDLGLRKPK